MLELVKNAELLKDELIRHRRYFHENPELGLELPLTKTYVMDTLKEYGYEPIECGKAGVVALAGGKKAGKVFLLRADMDALPLQEETNLPYASKIEGRMHACGHDTHAAMLLGAAKLLKQYESEIEGTIKLMFQPGEETLEGSKDMIEAGVLENPHVDAAMAIHAMTGSALKEGTMGIFGPGPAYASSDGFEINIQGKGGHAASPELTKDPLAVMTAIHHGVHEILAEHRASSDNCIMKICAMNGGNSRNIIPDTAHMMGTIRTYSTKVKDRLKKDLTTLVEYTAKARDVDVELKFLRSVPPLMVNENVQSCFLNSMRDMLGEENVYDLRTAWGGICSKASASEDFSNIAEKVPAAIGWFFIGDSRNGYKYYGHHPKVDFNDEYLYLGAAAYVKTGIDWLKKNK